MIYRIIKRENTKEHAFILQSDEYNANAFQSIIEFPIQKRWSTHSTYSSLEDAKTSLNYLINGLNPGETIVG
jgi:hypothetical protein